MEVRMSRGGACPDTEIGIQISRDKSASMRTWGPSGLSGHNTETSILIMSIKQEDQIRPNYY